jgi:hypothetical protein
VLVKTWRFITIVFASLSMGLAFCHLMEMPAKLRYDGGLWLTLLQTLYGTFGTIGAVLEVGAVLAAVVLVFLVVRRRPSFGWTLAAAACLAVAHAAWWIWVAPVNAALVPLTPDTLPANWTELRNQWEFTHAARAILQILGVSALVLSVLVETPERV